MPWSGNHGWDSNIRALKSRYRNGHMRAGSLAKSLRMFADKYDAKADVQDRLFNQGARYRVTALRLRIEADGLEEDPPKFVDEY